MVNEATIKKEPIKFEVLEGSAMYTFIHRPDKGNPKHRILPAYKIDLVLDTPEQLKKAQSFGLNIKKPKGPDDKFKGPYVQIKSKVADGREPPRVIDSQRNVIPPSILVGNGSKVRVRFLPWAYGEGEVTPILQEIQVLELVRYVPTEAELARKGDYLAAVPGGFVVPGGQVEEPVA